MMIIITLSVMSSLFLALPTARNPLSLLLLIIMISLCLSAMFSSYMSSWYAFLIFLIYISGMLVMFAYFTASNPNQSSMTVKSTLISLITIFIPVMMLFSSSKKLPLLPVENLQLTTMYLPHNGMALILVTFVLFMTMVIMVKMTKMSKGPMRTFM